MFKKILLCLDGSAYAEEMLPHVLELAQRFHSRVVLIQVVQMLPSLAAASAQEGHAILEEELRRLWVEAEEYLQGVEERLRKEGVDVESVATDGAPGEAIVRLASQHGVDLIAMATHGRSNIGKLVLGSVADYVIRHTGKPVLTMKPEE